MAGRPAREPRHTEPEPPDAREREIIKAARQVQQDLPEPYVAGKMFFRFDPGFQAELVAARRSWRGTETLQAHEDWPAEMKFDNEVYFTHDEALQTLASSLARRWGLDTTRVVHALATGVSVNYPYFRVQTDLEDAETGLVYTQVQVYSDYVWAKVRFALREVKATVPPPVPRRFPDSKQPRGRMRGMKSHVAARSLALYFLTKAPAGRRLTGGRRTAAGAEALWRAHVPARLRVGDGWPRTQRRLLAHVAGRRAHPVARLVATQQELGLGDAAWAEVLGVELAGADGSPAPDTWLGTRSEVPATRAFWDRVVASMPDLADDLTFDLWARSLVR